MPLVTVPRYIVLLHALQREVRVGALQFDNAHSTHEACADYALDVKVVTATCADSRRFQNPRALVAVALALLRRDLEAVRKAA